MNDQPEVQNTHVDIAVNVFPTEMGLCIDTHTPQCNVRIEFDTEIDPIKVQSILQCLPQFIVHAMSKVTAPDSPTTAQEWWDDGVERLGAVVAVKVP